MVNLVQRLNLKGIGIKTRKTTTFSHCNLKVHLLFLPRIHLFGNFQTLKKGVQFKEVTDILSKLL